jgi:hypothetical protein
VQQVTYVPSTTDCHWQPLRDAHVTQIGVRNAFCYKIWNNFLGQLFQQWEDFHLQKKIIIIMARAELNAEGCLNN